MFAIQKIRRLCCHTSIVLYVVPQLVFAQNLVELWSVKDLFMMPESAAYDETGKQIFVSNVNGYAKDGNGFISRVSANGKAIELKWLAGLNSPTGLVVHKGKRYVADYDELVIIDIGQKQIRNRIRTPDTQPGLNDVAISQSGQVFVSGSASMSIYTLKNDQLIVWKKDQKRLKNANGLFIKDQQFIHGGLQWPIFDLQTKKLVDGFKEPNAAIKDIDGIIAYSCGGYIVSLIDDFRLWHVEAGGGSKPLSELALDAIDIHYHKGKLYTPTVGGGLSVFELTDKDCATLTSAVNG